MLDAEEELEFLAGRLGTGRSLHEEALREPVSRLCQRPAETLPVTEHIATAIERMKKSGIGSLAVVDAEGLLVGIVTERDLLTKVLLEDVDVAATPVRAIMTPEPESLHPEDSMLYLMNKMHVGGFRHVPIVDDAGRPLHVLSIRDVVAYVLGRFERAVANLPPDAHAHLRSFVV